MGVEDGLGPIYNERWFRVKHRLNDMDGRGYYGRPGEGINGEGLNGMYYDWYSGSYRSTIVGNDLVSMDDVYNTAALFGSQVTWLYYGGTSENPYQILTGVSFSDGSRYNFYNDGNSTMGDFSNNAPEQGDSNFLDQAAKFGDWASIGLTGPSLGTNPALKVKPKYQPPSFNPANELKVNNAMKTASKYLDGVGKALGIISYIDHANKGFQSMQNGKIWEGLGYYGLSIIDVVIILNKSVDPYVLGTVFVYDIVDATAF